MARPLLQLTYSLSGIRDAARRFLDIRGGYRVFAFSGTLGAGKTTFIHAICDALGVTDPVSSPTFALIHEYRFPQAGAERVIFHMDWYRLKDGEEAIDTGMEDCLRQQDALCLVEWPERATALLPSPYLWITLEAVDETVRKLVVEER